MNEIFAIKIDFDKNASKPSRVFSTMSNLINAFESIDKLLLGSITVKIQSELLLEDIEIGSLIGRFKYLLESADDEAIKELDWKKLIGYYLVKGKYALLDFIDKKATITNKEEVRQLKNEMLSLASECNLNGLTGFTPLTNKSLLDSIETLTLATRELKANDRVYLYAQEKSAEFNLSFQISEESIDKLLTDRSLVSFQEMILKVKKPDYLGDSKWELRRGKTPINARITDLEWIANFRSRKISVLPGDSLLVDIECTSHYDSSGELVSDVFEITKVKDIIQFDALD